MYVLALLIGLVLLPVPTQAQQAVFREIPAAEAPVTLPPEAVAGRRAVHLRGNRPNNTVSVSRWFVPGAARAAAEIVVSRAAPGYAFANPPGPTALLTLFEDLRTPPAQPQAGGQADTALGPVAYVLFGRGEAGCVSFSKGWPGRTDQGGVQLIGYYCAAVRQPFDRAAAEAFLARLELRDPPRPTTPTVDRDPAALPIRVSWQGRAEPGRGILRLERDSGGGALEMAFGALRCEGYWQRLGGNYDAAVAPFGEWRVLCADGLAARGDYLSRTPRQAQGDGVDDNGRPVSFRLDLP